MRRKGSVGLPPVVAVYAFIVAAVVAGGAYLTLTQVGPVSTTTTTTTTSGSGAQGVVAGYVTVGPAQPVCRANESCNVNLTGYRLVFTSVCTMAMESCPPLATFTASISPGGHYSILLPAGDYEVSGISPSCPWMGCSSAFPKLVVVAAGMQLVVDVNIDTGIR